MGHVTPTLDGREDTKSPPSSDSTLDGLCPCRCLVTSMFLVSVTKVALLKLEILIHGVDSEYRQYLVRSLALAKVLPGHAASSFHATKW